MAVAGTSSTNEPEYARVFYETMQDMVVFGDGPEDKLARATCHEIGRQFESVDSPEDDDSIRYFRKTRAFSPQ